MKRAVILHGTDSEPSHNWQPWLRETLRGFGYEVWDAESPIIINALNHDDIL